MLDALLHRFVMSNKNCCNNETFYASVIVCDIGSKNLASSDKEVASTFCVPLDDEKMDDDKWINGFEINAVSNENPVTYIDGSRRVCS